MSLVDPEQHLGLRAGNGVERVGTRALDAHDTDQGLTERQQRAHPGRRAAEDRVRPGLGVVGQPVHVPDRVGVGPVHARQGVEEEAVPRYGDLDRPSSCDPAGCG